MSAKEKKQEQPQEPVSFETGLKELEELVRRLESGEIALEEALQVYERGIKLSKKLEQQLLLAEKKIEVLSKEGSVEEKEISDYLEEKKDEIPF